MHYYLSRWTGDGTDAAPYQPMLAPDGADWSVIDLRPDPTVQAGRCLLATTDRPVEETGGRYLGDDPGADLPLLVRERLATELGLSLTRVDLRRVVVELLVDHARVDGTRWRPLRPLARGRNAWEIRLGGLLWSLPRVAGGATHTESFTGADNLSLAAADVDLIWANVQVGWSVQSNRVDFLGASTGTAYGRAEHDAAGLDQYCQATLAASTGNPTQFGPSVRFDPSSNTAYMASRGLNNSNEIVLRKTVAGARTNLTSAVTVALSLPEVIRAEIEGSTLRGLINGVEHRTVTDTSIASGSRGGLYGFRPSGGALAGDDWSFGDLPTGTPLTLTDTPTGARLGATTGQLLTGLVTADTPGPARMSTPAGTLTTGVVLGDGPSGTRATSPPGALLLGLAHLDWPAALRVAGRTGSLVLNTLHEDQVRGVRLSGPAGSLLLGADATLSDLPAGIRLSAPPSSLAIDAPTSRGQITPVHRTTGGITPTHRAVASITGR